MTSNHEKYDPERDCELDAAFHIYWRHGKQHEVQQYPDTGVIGWAQAHYPEQHAKLAAAFKASVREVLG